MSEKKTNCGIYKITNLIPNEKTGICKVYIGSSKNLKSRKYEHFRTLENKSHNNKYLLRAYEKYGKDNFKFEHIKYIEKYEDALKIKEELLKWEQYYLNEFIINGKINYRRCYNITPTAGSNLGRKQSKQEIEKRIKYLKGRICKEETKVKISIAQKDKERPYSRGNKYALGYRHTEQDLLKISIASKTRIYSEDTLKKKSLSASKNNKWFTAISPLGEVYRSNNQRQFARDYNLESKSINGCLKGKTNTHKKWKFKYDN
jgi:group I intron endonuclease